MEWCDIFDPYWTMDNFKKIFIFLLLFFIIHSGIHWISQKGVKMQSLREQIEELKSEIEELRQEIEEIKNPDLDEEEDDVLEEINEQITSIKDFVGYEEE